MLKVQRSAMVRHSAQVMYDLVNDVGRYQEFLPWCGHSAMLESAADYYVAQIGIDFKAIKKSFTTRNTLQAPANGEAGEYIITMGLVDGPFSDLAGNWLIRDFDDLGSKVELNLEFDFDNFILRKTIGSVFGLIADSMVTSFCERADALYPKA